MSNLRRGSRGPEVVLLQQKLNEQLFPSHNLTDDGIFGRLTQEAVRAFQRQAGLDRDGVVGPITRAALGMPNPDNAFTHRVRLHFRSISLTNVPFNSILSHTQAVYAQYGIKVEFAGGQSLLLSPTQRQRLSQIDGTCVWNVTNGEYAELLGLGNPVSPRDIVVFLVDRFSESINGCGGHMTNRPGCIVARAGTKYCTAHEVCHVLLGSSFSPTHINNARNLMHPVDLNRSAVPQLTAAQVARVKASAQCMRI